MTPVTLNTRATTQNPEFPDKFKVLEMIGVFTFSMDLTIASQASSSYVMQPLIENPFWKSKK